MIKFVIKSLHTYNKSFKGGEFVVRLEVEIVGVDSTVFSKMFLCSLQQYVLYLFESSFNM